MSALNPNHPVTRIVNDQWHKIVDLLMKRFGQTEVTFTEADVATLEEDGGCGVVFHAKKDSIVIRLVSQEEGEKIAREAGGLPS